MPNKLKYCGPSNERTLFDYASKKVVDQGLLDMLSKFECLYPYVKGIAKANKIRNPFDRRVVEAYWLGNSLLDNVSMSDLYMNLKDEHHLAKRLSRKYFNEIVYKIPEGAKPHHSFQVLNVFINTGKKEFKKVFNTLESCLILPATIKSFKKGLFSNNEFAYVEIIGLEYKNSKITFSRRETIKVRFKFFGQAFVDDLSIGDLVSVHWGFVCDKLTVNQHKRLKAWNQYHLNLANLTM